MLQQKFKKLTFKSQDDPVLSQAFARIVLSSVLLVTIAFLEIFSVRDYSAALGVISLHTLFSLAFIYAHNKHPVHSEIKKYLGLVLDLGTLSMILHTSDIRMLFIYPIYLWVIVGNGMRFGTKYLYCALSIGFIFFATAVLTNTHLAKHMDLNISLSIGIIVLGLFYSKLIAKIHKLNNELEQKVQERTKQLAFQLYHDDLTGLKNRKALREDCTQEKCQELFLVDIDDFNNYNELYGMDVGNKILIEFSKTLKSVAQKYEGEVYRLYGDGFALVFLQDRSEIKQEKGCILLVHELENFYVQLDNGQKLYIDFTVASVSNEKQMLEKADMALNFARKQGRKYQVYNKSFDTKKEIEKNIQWKKNIRDAIIEDRFLPVFQPITDKYCNIVKYETLIRMELDGKLIAPFFFLDIAIKTHQYEQLTAMMVDKSFQFMQDVDKEFSINLSLSDINNKFTVNHLMAKIKKHNVGSKLIIEILETEDSDDFENVQKFVEEVRALGVKIAIDDFGSGYSNFDHLFKLMPDFIKIDGSLIKKIDTDVNSYKLVESIVFLAKNLGIETIAEFVHSKEVFETCKRIGIDSFQGFYLYEPMQGKEVLKLTQKEKKEEVSA